MRRTALITGASRGFGRALAEGLAVEGWNLTIDARDATALGEARRALEGAGPGSVVALAGDVEDPLHVAALVSAATAQGRLSLVVNNAGTLGPSPLPELRRLGVDDLERTLRTNVAAPLRVIRTALPHLRTTRGIVVNVTSDAAVEGYPGWGAYGASKAALDQMSRVLAAEEPHVLVYSVDPGDMATRMHQDAFPGEDISDRPPPADRVPPVLALLAGRPPSGRYRVDDLPPAPVRHIAPAPASAPASQGRGHAGRAEAVG